MPNRNDTIGEENNAEDHVASNDEAIAAARTTLKRYKRNQEKLLYLAGGVGALLLFGGLIKSASSSSPPLLLALLVTLAIFSGTLLAATKIMYESTCDSISIWIEKAANSDSTVKVIGDDSDCNLPPGTSLLMWSGLVLLILTMVVLLIMTWWPVFSHYPSIQDCTTIRYGTCPWAKHNA